MATLIVNSFLEDQSLKIKGKPIPWEGYSRADLISSEELDLIKKIDRQPRAKVESTLLTAAPSYTMLYLQLLKKLPRIDTSSYIISLINESLLDHDERVQLYLRSSETDPELPFEALIKLLALSDDFVQLGAARILALLIPEASQLPPSVIPRYLDSITRHLDPVSSTPNSQDVAVQCLENILSRHDAREAVWQSQSLMKGLVDLLKGKLTAQMAYQTIFCFWLLTFEVTIAQQINAKYDIVPLLVDIAQNAAKEKVIRIVLATFRNLVSKAPAANLPSMLVAKLLPFVRSLGTRKLSDEEVIADAEFLRDELSEKFESLTTYDEYVSELKSGHLSWTPVHSSETFWKDNVTKLNANNYELLKLLVTILQQSEDPLVLAVAAHDVGQYLKYHDRGKKVLTDMGAKTRVMDLMIHGSSDVRYHALTSVQQFVSNPWVTA